jgi:hypothetical protein
VIFKWTIALTLFLFLAVSPGPLTISFSLGAGVLWINLLGASVAAGWLPRREGREQNLQRHSRMAAQGGHSKMLCFFAGMGTATEWFLSKPMVVAARHHVWYLSVPQTLVCLFLRPLVRDTDVAAQFVFLEHFAPGMLVSAGFTLLLAVLLCALPHSLLDAPVAVPTSLNVVDDQQ